MPAISFPSPPGEVEIQIERLREFAAELSGQAQALDSHRSALEGLAPAASEWALLGDFAEAQSLADVHRQALARVTHLVDQLTSLVGYADSVAVEVANRYEDADASAGDTYGPLDLRSRLAGR